MELFAYFGFELSVYVLLIVDLILPMGEGALISELALTMGGVVLTELGLVLHLVALDEILSFFLIPKLSFGRFRRGVGSRRGIR